MYLDDYKYIVTIAEEKSINKAARKLYVMQSSLSQCLKRVEATYGVTLFRRDTQGVSLTSEGEIFIEYAKKILDADKELFQIYSDLKNGPSGTLSIGATQLMHSQFIKMLILKYHSQFPNVELNFIEAPSLELAQLLIDNRIDLAFLHAPVNSTQLNLLELFPDRLALLPRTESNLKEKSYHLPGEEHGFIHIKDLANEPIALLERTAGITKMAEEAFAHYHIDPQIKYRTRNFAMLHSFAKMNMASAIVLECYVSGFTDDEYYYIDTETANSFTALLAWKNDGYLSIAAQELIHLVKEKGCE